ncbi:MAG: S41 family peptidase [Methylocystaceae bacterium]
MIVLMGGNPLSARGEDPVERVRAIINLNFVDTVPLSVTEAKTIDAMLVALGDPYAQYFTVEEFKQFQEALNQTFVGIGIVFDLIPQGVLVKSILNQSPAEKAGLQSGDIVQSVDGISLIGKDFTAAGNLIRGVEGTKIKLQVKRQNKSLQLLVTRRAINLPSVTHRLLAGRIGYINICTFSSDTGQRFGEAVTELKKQGARSWIIDLQDNGGGYLEAARLVAGYFIPGQTCLLTDNRSTSSHPLTAESPGLILNEPTAVLVNEQTASASEVLAGALQDYGKAVIIGRQTYGKGCVQWLFNLGNDGILKLTCENYRTPLGRKVNHVGIIPDLATTADSLKMAELLLSGQALTSKQKKSVLVIRGRNYPINLTLATSTAYQPIYHELLRLITPPGKVAPTWR